MPKTRVDWRAIQKAYVSQQGSLRQISQRFSVPLRTLERRCARDGWARALAVVDGSVSAVAAEVAAREGERIGLDAANLVERTLSLTDSFLNKIESKLAAGELSVTELRNLASAFRDTVGIGRQGLGLDNDQVGFHYHYHGPRITAEPPRIDLPSESKPVLQAG